MTATLTDLCAAIVDCEHKTAPVGDGFAISIGTKAMKDGRLVLGSCKPVSKETYKLWTRRLTPEEGDLILAREAPVGDVVRVPKGRLVCLGQRTVLIRPDTDRVDPRFLHYWLLGPIAQTDMNSRASGATVPHLNVEDIRALDVTALPDDRRMQVQAGTILGAIDDLIENSGRRIALLEQMAQAIYREWFVHFRYPGHEDDEFVDSPLGLVPSTWGVRSLFEEAEVSFGFALKSKGFGPDGEWQVIRIRDIPNGFTPTRTNEFPGSRYVVEDGDTLIGMDGEFHMCRWSGGAALLNQRVTKIRPNGTLGVEALYRALRAPIRKWNESIVGTTVAHLGKSHLEAIALAAPPASVARTLSEPLDDLGSLMLALRSSNGTLAKLRDLLLPKLVTGAIDVSKLDLDALPEASAA